MSGRLALRSHLRDTRTVIVRTRTAGGSERLTPVWAVEVDDGSFLRSAYGPDAAWYRRAIRPGGLAVIIDGDPVPVTLIPVHDEHVLDDVDIAYHTKYADQPRTVRQLVSRVARSTTVRVCPARSAGG